MTIGFWEAMLGDVGYYERRAINAAAEQIDMLRATDEAQQFPAHKQLRRLYALDKAQSKELARLRTMVKVLSELLIEKGIADEQLLRHRMESALTSLEEASPPKLAAAGGDPYRGAFPRPMESQPPTEDDPTTRCRRCGDEVLLRRTQITDEGNVCDDCYFHVVRRR